MTDPTIYLGPARRQVSHDPVSGELATLDGEAFYRISNYDRMRPFFMTIVSDSDHWMFLSSHGGLTAGRRNPSHALFPYVTDDKIHDAGDLTGSKTLFLVSVDDRQFLWQPFTDVARDVYAGQRNLWKSLTGNKIVFEDVNRDLGLTFQYAWQSSARFGFLKRARLVNHGTQPISLRLLDGLQNLLPAGTDRMLQATSSTLLDAYKRNELEPETGLGLFRLSSIPVDRPEPSESLQVTTVWSEGLPDPLYLLSVRQLDRFREGLALRQEIDVRAERGAYFVQATVTLAPAASLEWSIVAELDQGPAEVAALRQGLHDKPRLRASLDQDIQRGTDRLRTIVAQADGLQMTRERLTTTRHFANVLFNVMRGGVFHHNAQITSDDLRDFLWQHNRIVCDRQREWLTNLPERLSVDELRSAAAGRQDSRLESLCYEYLPLTFSRRHGDPSRPWNDFSIDIRHEDGREKLTYQGNWRDIFQNWEALGRSFPAFLPAMICKFLSASTADGYNPYRVSREGIDWEITEPENPWSFIGYWGDHQVVYLLKLLEAAEAHQPGILRQFLTKELFAYANVPYRIRPYDQLLADPHHTIDYDLAVQARVDERVANMGADGKLLLNHAGQVHLVNLTEKLLVSLLAKFAHFVPEAGIWMNTQRPEWNDANNALVGRGASMVTLYYLRRYQQFVAGLLRSLGDHLVIVSEEVATLLAEMTHTFEQHANLLQGPLSGRDRQTILNELGEAGSRYRKVIYERGFSERRSSVTPSALVNFCEHSLEFIDHSIRANRRDNGMYHAYNLISFSSKEGVNVRRLYDMLEGQVAVLSSGVLTPEQSLELLSSLRNSDLYREDQRSYLLYPDRPLPCFLAINRIPPERVAKSELLQRLLARGDTQLIVRDVMGDCHFQGNLRNSAGVEAALDRIRGQGEQEGVDRERQQILDVWEELFDHQSYTGRSGTFFGYEGLGCIYWHMVSKLLLAVQEVYCRASRQGANEQVLARLAACYEEVREGIGVTKNPADYGAFPTDPYSHTPSNAGAQQPGMTGQVKEDILCRWGELGVCVDEGQLRFWPALLRSSEFIAQEEVFHYVDRDGQPRTLLLERDSLAFTYCQTPVIYRKSASPRVEVRFRDGHVQRHDGLLLDRETSAAIFRRDHSVERIQVDLLPGRM